MQILEEQQLTIELEQEKYEEEDTINSIGDEPSTPGEQPLTGGHLSFREMGITPPPATESHMFAM